jgi:hypothetical protein
VEEIRQGRETLNELTEKAGRDPQSIEVMAFGRPGQFRDRAEVKDLEKAGVSRMTIWLTQTEGSGTIAEIEELAGKVLA